jgi:hypothetical protein
MYDNVNYKTNISNYLGTEATAYLTYKLFRGLDVTLIGAYLWAGQFYKDTLTPKPYAVAWVDTSVTSPSVVPYKIWGPNLSAQEFKLTNSWTIQWKLDFKFNINPNAQSVLTNDVMQQK